MPEVVVRLPSGAVIPRPPRGMTIVTPTDRIGVPYAPRETENDGLARQFEVMDRPGRKALLRRGGPGLQTETFTIFVGFPDHQRSIESILARLKYIANHGDPTVVFYGPMELAHLWRLTGLKIQAVMRAEHTHEVTRANVTMTWTEASDSAISVSPVSGGAPAAPPPSDRPVGRGAAGPAATHTVRRGDTLSKIAATHLGNASRWPEIARLNDIRNANRITPGQVLRLPRR